MGGFRWASRMITVVVIMMLTGCDLEVLGMPKSTPLPLPADQVVFEVEAYGGLVPPIVTAFSGPALVVYGDGRVIQFGDEKRPSDSPPAYVITTVSPIVVAEFAALVFRGRAVRLLDLVVGPRQRIGEIDRQHPVARNTVRFHPPQRGDPQCGMVAIAMHEQDGRNLRRARGSRRRLREG